MYYEAKMMDGWLWHCTSPDRPLEKATAEQTVKHLLGRIEELGAEADWNRNSRSA